MGDNASMCFIELVDYNENMKKEVAKKPSKTRRSRKKSAAAVAEEAAPVVEATETPETAAEEASKSE